LKRNARRVVLLDSRSRLFDKQIGSINLLNLPV
jgi:hypothetical protein